MTENTPADTAMRDQFDAASAESDAYLTARGAAPSVDAEPGQAQAILAALIAEMQAGRVRLCVHVPDFRIATTPSVVWTEDLTLLTCPRCDLVRRATEARTCRGCGTRGTLEGGTEHAVTVGPMVLSTIWCPACTPPSSGPAAPGRGSGRPGRGRKKRPGKRGR